MRTIQTGPATLHIHGVDSCGDDFRASFPVRLLSKSEAYDRALSMPHLIQHFEFEAKGRTWTGSSIGVGLVCATSRRLLGVFSHVSYNAHFEVQ